jgi:hypothetical protein
VSCVFPLGSRFTIPEAPSTCPERLTSRLYLVDHMGVPLELFRPKGRALRRYRRLPIADRCRHGPYGREEGQGICYELHMS